MNNDFEVFTLVLGPAATNTYFFYNKTKVGEDQKHHGILIDPAADGAEIVKACEERNLVTDGILLTHAHFDHIDGVEDVRRLTSCKVYCGAAEQDLCENPELNVSLDFGKSLTVKPDLYLNDGDLIEIAGIYGKVIFTPGHTKGSVSYYFGEAGVLFSGDTLFAGSIGRSDLPTGSAATLIRSIREKLLVLPDQTDVFPGHMSPTTIGTEKHYNQFLL